MLPVTLDLLPSLCLSPFESVFVNEQDMHRLLCGLINLECSTSGFHRFDPAPLGEHLIRPLSAIGRSSYLLALSGHPITARGPGVNFVSDHVSELSPTKMLALHSKSLGLMFL